MRLRVRPVFLHGVFANRVGGCEDGHRPRHLPFLHALQQAHGALAMQQEVLVHDKEGLHLELSSHLLHDFKQLVPAFEEVDEISFAPEEGRCRAEVAAHGTANGRDDSCRSRTFAFG